MSEHAPSAPDVLVVGGGIIGLACAWRARRRGLSVTLLERGVVGQGASHVAAGMLAPVAEAEFGAAGQALLELGLRSAALWPAFAAELQEDSGGLAVPLLRTGTLVLARDHDEARELERQLEFRRSLGLAARRLRPSAARELEPSLAPTVRLALEAPDDHCLDPRVALRALRRACELSGVRIHEGVAVRSLVLDPAGERLSGLLCDGGTLVRGERLPTDRVVLAAGAWSAQIGGLPARAQVPVRPVKGQILRLRDPAGPGLITRVVRHAGGYLVPRGDGRYVLGASVEEQGFDLQPTAGRVYELLRDCAELVPGIEELRIEELSVGLRPGSPDNVPTIGPGAVAGLVWATGHYRNGILLAPLTAELVLAALTGESASAPSARASLARSPRPTPLEAAPA